MEIKKNSIVEIYIDDMTVEGAGVGHIDGAAVFVDDSVVGDHLEIIIIKAAKNYFVGKIKKILNPSKLRIENDCASFPRCGGCAFRNISYQSESEIKQKRVLDCIKRIAKNNTIPNDIVGCENIASYRNKAQYKFSLDREGNIQIGFFARHSHRVVDAETCLLQPKEFTEIVEIVRKYAVDNNVSVYDEVSGKGLLRQLYIRKGFATNEIMVCLVINGNRLYNSDKLVEELVENIPQIASVVININRDKTNVILGDECQTIYGKDTITDILCGVEFTLSPHSFYQVNPAQAEKLFKKAEEYADFKGGETVLDLYCGVGAVGLCTAKNAGKLIGVEIIPQAVENAKQNALANGIDNAEFICADATTAAEMLANRGITPDVVMIDPPRKGCTPELISTVTEDMNPKRVVYISCDPATLARDIAIFEEKGYTLKELTPFDLFPRTPHVENVALLVR
ncbi:MAG: 23S rRNA (uracil(1939)-C(5))-methyltransferase RlmD [Clostridia bacterium]|nr:23S rRNA (uracil(1939)-C(5))-methyltransferase RlmD [Clostridia bacterium]